MLEPMSRPARAAFAAVATWIVAVLGVGVTAVVAEADGVDGGDVATPMPVVDAPAVPAERALSPTAPPGPFPPIVPGFEVNAVRTPAGFVLPVLGGSAGAWEVRTPCGASAVVRGVPVPGAHVVLDPGHGGSEPGAVGPSGLTERDLNLDVARRVEALLEAEGAVVALTRDRDVRVTLATRAEIARSLDPIVFLSIHHNAAPLGRGAAPAPELYHQLDDPTSRRLAGLLWEELTSAFAPFGSDWAFGDDPGARARRSLRTGEDFYGVLRNALDLPAVLIEAAYLSNPAEEALLATEAFRDAEARAIADAVLRLLTTDDPGSGFRPTKEAAAPAGGGGGSAGCVDPDL